MVHGRKVVSHNDEGRLAAASCGSLRQSAYIWSLRPLAALARASGPRGFAPAIAFGDAAPSSLRSASVGW